MMLHRGPTELEKKWKAKAAPVLPLSSAPWVGGADRRRAAAAA